MTLPPIPQALQALITAQPGYPTLLEGLGAAAEDGRAVRVRGAPGGARLALLAQLALERPLLLVFPSEDDLQGVADDLESLLPAGHSVAKNPPLDLYEPLEDDEDLGHAGTTAGARLQLLQRLSSEDAPTILLSGSTSLLQRLPAPSRAGVGALELTVGGTLDPHALARRLVDVGCRRVTLVEAPGEFAIRGGIVDVFPLGAPRPVRVELFGDEIESLRLFEAGTQRSVGTLERYRLSLLSGRDYVHLRREDGAQLLDHLPSHAAVVVVDPLRCRARLIESERRFFERAEDLLTPAQVLGELGRRPRVLLDDTGEDPLGEDAREAPFPFAPGDVLTGSGADSVTNELARRVQDGQRVTVLCSGEAERIRLHEVFGKAGLDPALAETLRGGDEPAGLNLVEFSLADGFAHTGSKLALLAAHRLFSRHRRREADARAGARTRRRGASHAAIESFADLVAGMPVVHISHGIAIFRGIVRRERDGQPRDFLQLEFDGGDLFIPTDKIGLVRRYIGPTDKTPRLSKLGGSSWRKKTKKAQEAVRDLAADLLEIQAERRVRPGFAFPPDDRWQALFEESFGFTDTADQARITVEVKQDMEQDQAMDRLVCGDVGYGKTEIAVRAAFKAAAAGKQVAVLAPTTILAHQHHRSFSERMANYPLTVEVVSRFRSSSETRAVVKEAKEGKVDVLIGTHRLLSRDVAFQDLGLVIVDEEQRFGVAHKERLKALRRTVDLLTLTATPIPRTLHMALSGGRDISVLETPPPGRTPVETRIARFEKGLIKRVIERELARDGQVFFVHDRVRTIDGLARQLQEFVPTARVVVVHGQLPEHEIEDRMLRFVEHEADVMVATTLIENGLDVPRANTLIVDRAHMYGLAELHQLRGRVGRSDVPASAWFLLPEHGNVSDVARKRLRAIEEFTDFGAGFQIAMRDLEIRGAGNVLGAEQSGHIVNVGYDLYCRLLKRAMHELDGARSAARVARPAPDRPEPQVAEGSKSKPVTMAEELELDAGEIEVVLEVPAYVPDAYVADVSLKIECYRKLSTARDEEELEELDLELRDRYGPLPEVLANLFKLRRLRIRAAGRGVLKITRQDVVLQLRCADRERLQAGVVDHFDALRPIDQHMLYVVMREPDACDETQLDYLLEVLGPLSAAERRAQEEQAVPQPSAEGQAERQRRLRARSARQRSRGGRRRKPAKSKSSQQAKPARPQGPRNRRRDPGRR